MDRKSLWISLLGCALVAVTLTYQNCSNQKFDTVAASNLKGSLSSMSTDGAINGEVQVVGCKNDKDLEDGDCPNSILIRIYAIMDDHSKKQIGEVSASLQDKKDDQGNTYYVYVFSYTVDAAYLCRKIEVYAVDHITGAEVLVEHADHFLLWGGDKKCDDTPGSNSGGSTSGGSTSGGSTSGGSTSGGSTSGGSTSGGSTSGGSSGGDPAVDIQGQNQDGRLVEIRGSCAANADVVSSGDILSVIDHNESCASGSFKHCAILSKYATNNVVTIKQTKNSKTAEDSVTLVGGNPVLVLTIDEFKKGPAAQDLSVKGRCTPGGIVKLTIYNQQKASITCDANGNYSYVGKPLVAGLTNRIMFAELSTLFGKVNIKADVDMESVTPSCTISQTVGRSDWCKDQAGTVSGTCYIGLPVIVSMNGNDQNIGYCPDGTFSVKNVLLEDVAKANTIKISQKTPYGKSCEATKSLTDF